MFSLFLFFVNWLIKYLWSNIQNFLLLLKKQTAVIANAVHIWWIKWNFFYETVIYLCTLLHCRIDSMQKLKKKSLLKKYYD